jgi:hypothetical protein
MATVPPVILVLDVNALSTATPREWLEFSRVGGCVVPQVVYEEMKFLFDRSPDPDLERIARAFNHFYATSGWQISDEHAHHPLLKSTSNQSLTKRSRVSLAVGRCAYAQSLTHPTSLVVLVSSDRTMLQRIYDVQATNLCAITGQALLQWCRTGQRPIAVSQKLQRLRVVSGVGGVSGVGASALNPTHSNLAHSTSTLSHIPSSARLTPSAITPKKPAVRHSSLTSTGLPQLISIVFSLATLAAAAWLVWFIIRQGFEFNNLNNSSGLIEPALHSEHPISSLKHPG